MAKKPAKDVRSAVTGKFVPKGAAKQNPRETVTETRKPTNKK